MRRRKLGEKNWAGLRFRGEIAGSNFGAKCVEPIIVFRASDGVNAIFVSFSCCPDVLNRIGWV